MRLAVAILLVGCGRIAFDPLHDAAATGDATGTMYACLIGTTAPDPITVTSHVVRVTFFGGMTDEAGVLVSVKTAYNGTTLNTAMTDAAGLYSLTVPTSGVPLSFAVTLEKSGVMTSMITTDQPRDGNVDFGESYMGTTAGAGSLYAAGVATRDQAKGTLFVTVQDCNGAGISGATIQVMPAPQRIVYSNGIGVPTTNATSTAANGWAWALNAPPGDVVLTADKAGLTFLPQPLEIVAGDNFVGARMRRVTP